MFGRDNNKPFFTEENRMQYHLNAVNQLQLFGNCKLSLPSEDAKSLPVGCNVDPTNFFGNYQNTPMLRSNKLGRETDYNLCHDKGDRQRGIQNQTHVSTGLKLSYDDDEHNSSVTSSSGSMIATPPLIISYGECIMNELDWQKEEFNQYMKIQEQVLAKGIKEITVRQITRYLGALEKGVNKKLHEKDLEIENINRKNRDLGDKIQQAVTDAQWWHNKAKYNESMIAILKNHLQQAISHGADQGKEGFGDNELDDDASYIDPNNYLGNISNGIGKKASINQGMVCKVCKFKEVSVLLMPCRHLCLCKDCDELMGICPICQIVKTASVQVYFP